LLHELLTGGAAQRSAGATLPPYIDEVVQWTTSVDRDTRPRSADEFAAVLQLAANRDLGSDWRTRASLAEFVASVPVPVPVPPVAPALAAAPQPIMAPPPPDATRADRLQERRRRRHTRARVAVVAGVVGAALAVSAAAFALRQGSTPSKDATPRTTTVPGSFALGHADASGALATSVPAARASTTVRTTAPTATAADLATAFDGIACALVDAADASRVLGEAVRVTPTPDAPNDCNYLASSGIIGEITVAQGLTGAPATAADFDRLVHGMSGTKQAIKGLGENAVFVGRANDAVLFVLQRGWVVQVVAMTRSDVPDRERQLARLALARIG
jgi:hypothetical protein